MLLNHPVISSLFRSSALRQSIGGIALLVAAFGCGARSDLSCTLCAASSGTGSGVQPGGSSQTEQEETTGDSTVPGEGAVNSTEEDRVRADMPDALDPPIGNGFGDVEGSTLLDGTISEDTEPGRPVPVSTSTNPGGFQARDTCPGTVVLTTTELEALAGCSRITGDLSISIADPSESLSALGLLVEVDGTLALAGVSSLAGLGLLEHVGNLTLEGTELTEVSSLRSLETIGSTGTGGQLRIVGNPLLEEIRGLRSLLETTSLFVTDNPNLRGIGQGSFGSNLTNINIFGNSQLSHVEPFGVLNLSTLELSGDSLKDLDLIAGAVVVGRLIIFETPSLEDTSGLNNLIAVPELLRLQATGMENLNDLNSLQLAERIIITSENSLTNLDGISQLTSVGTLSLERLTAVVEMPEFAAIEVMENLSVSGNTSLVVGPSFPRLRQLETLRYADNPRWGSLLGLNSLVTVEQMEIAHNDELTSLSLPALQVVGEQLIVRCNSQLSGAELLAFESVDVQRMTEAGNLDSTALCSSP